MFLQRRWIFFYCQCGPHLHCFPITLYTRTFFNVRLFQMMIVERAEMIETVKGNPGASQGAAIVIVTETETVNVIVTEEGWTPIIRIAIASYAWNCNILAKWYALGRTECTFPPASSLSCGCVVYSSRKSHSPVILEVGYYRAEHSLKFHVFDSDSKFSIPFALLWSQNIQISQLMVAKYVGKDSYIMVHPLYHTFECLSILFMYQCVAMWSRNLVNTSRKSINCIFYLCFLPVFLTCIFYLYFLYFLTSTYWQSCETCSYLVGDQRSVNRGRRSLTNTGT